MKLATVILCTIVLVAVGGAFLSGRYVGAFDAERRFREASTEIYAADSAQKLYVVGAAAELIRNSQTAEGLRILEQYAQLQAKSVAGCLNSVACTEHFAGTEEYRVRLLALASHYASAAGSGATSGSAPMAPNPSFEPTATGKPASTAQLKR